nr:twin-arginine translocation signal domain-containing protein [Chloroflexia bacterium]
MDRPSRLVEILENATPTSRREFLKRSAIMGASIPVFGSLLAACGGDEEDEPGGESAPPTATTPRSGLPTTDTGAGGRGTPTVGADAEKTPGDEATPTEAAEEATPTEAATEATPTESAGGTSSGEPQEGGMLIALGHHEIASLSPDDWGPSVHYFIVGNIHEPLLRLDPWFALQPALCESFEVSDDGLTYTFTLREGLTFHEGEPFTAADVKYTFDFRRDPAN